MVMAPCQAPRHTHLQRWSWEQSSALQTLMQGHEADKRVAGCAGKLYGRHAKCTASEAECSVDGHHRYQAVCRTFLVISASVLAMAKVPLEKASISNTPAGPAK
jgi:hypothetical protein